MGAWSSGSDYVLPHATRYSFTNEIDTWDVSVWVPPADLRGDAPLAALYVLDPSATFPVTAITALTTTRLAAGHLAPLAVVGVGPTGDFMEVYPKRMRDMTPNDVMLDVHRAIAPHGAGGADAFLSTVVDEIAPQVESAHALSATGRAIGGWSLGGLLTCHALLTRTADFDRYLAVAPSLWWDDELLVKQALSLAPGTLAGKQAYLGTGEHESDFDKTWPPVPEAMRALAGEVDMCGSAARFAAGIRAAGASVEQELITDEHHATVWGGAMTRGLVSLYGR